MKAPAAVPGLWVALLSFSELKNLLLGRICCRKKSFYTVQAEFALGRIVILHSSSRKRFNPESEVLRVIGRAGVRVAWTAA